MMCCCGALPMDQTDYAPRPMRVSNVDIACLVWAILFHIFDLYTDVNVTLHYFNNGERYYGIATIVIILIPSVVTSCVSYRMYRMDMENDITYKWNRNMKVRIVMLFLQLAPVLRYIESLKFACKSKRAERQNNKEEQERYYILMLKEDADVALLRVFECFLESAPQQVLQISYLLKSYFDKQPVELGFTGYDPAISALSSLVGMAICLLTYQKSIRYVQEDKNNINWKGSLFIFGWHFSVAISRILILGALLCFSWVYALSAVAAHWILMTLSLSLLESHQFCTSVGAIKFQKFNIFNSLANFLFSSVLGLVYIFTFITPGEGGTCKRYSCYYIICLIENIIGAVLWYHFKDTNWVTISVTVLCIVPFVFGCLFMIIYHWRFHPKDYIPPSVIPQRRAIQPAADTQLACTPSPKNLMESRKVPNGSGLCEIGQGDDTQTEVESCLDDKL